MESFNNTQKEHMKAAARLLADKIKNPRTEVLFKGKNDKCEEDGYLEEVRINSWSQQIIIKVNGRVYALLHFLTMRLNGYIVDELWRDRLLDEVEKNL